MVLGLVAQMPGKFFFMRDQIQCTDHRLSGSEFSLQGVSHSSELLWNMTKLSNL